MMPNDPPPAVSARIRHLRVEILTPERICAALGLLAAILFFWLASINLEAQGLNQDELFQARGAFAYVGGATNSALDFAGFPLMNTPYAGAIKTALYGGYLFIFQEFSVASWRGLGIALAAAGIFGFAWVARKALSPFAMAVLLALLITDPSLALTAHFDYGPMALSFAFRLLLIGVYIRGQAQHPTTPSNSRWLGIIAGISIFEKLSNVVLAPVLVLMLASKNRWSRAHLRAAATGFAVGLLPLAAVNMLSLIRWRTFISLSEAGMNPHLRSWPVFLSEFQERFLTIPAGQVFWERALGRKPSDVMLFQETHMIVLLLLLAFTLAVGGEFLSRPNRTALTMLLGFSAIGTFLFLIPRTTGIHHWIMVTPFQYCAFAATVHLKPIEPGRLGRFGLWWRWLQKGFLGCLAVYLLIHTLWMRDLTRDLKAGLAGVYFHPAFTKVGRYAASRHEEALFINAAWGTWMPMYCFSNGDFNFAYEPFWNYTGPKQLENLIAAVNRKAVYLVTTIQPLGFDGKHPPQVKQIADDMERLPGWREIPPDDLPEGVDGVISVRKFVRAAAAP